MCALGLALVLGLGPSSCSPARADDEYYPEYEPPVPPLSPEERREESDLVHIGASLLRADGRRVEGRDEGAKEKYAEAVERAEAFLAKYRTPARRALARYYLVRAVEGLGLRDRLIEEAEALLRDVPAYERAADVWFRLGLARREQGDLGRAAEALARAVAEPAAGGVPLEAALAERARTIAAAIALERGEAPFPDLAGRDLATGAGVPSLATVAGARPAAVLFFVAWKAEPNALAAREAGALRERFGGGRLAVIGVSLDSDDDAARALAGTALDAVIAAPAAPAAAKGWRDDVRRRFGLDRLPKIYLVDRRGRVRGTGADAAVVEAMLAE